MIKNIKIKVPLVDQFKDVKDKKWKRKSCAICSFKMIIGFSNKKYLKIEVGELIDEALKMNGYLENIGWKHKTITDLAKKYGINLKFIEKFPKTIREKTKLLSRINKLILIGKPIMISLHYKLNKKKGGHMVVINGIRTKDKIVVGYHIQDSDNRFRGNSYYLSKNEFLFGWRGGMIYFAR